MLPYLCSRQRDEDLGPTATTTPPGMLSTLFAAYHEESFRRDRDCNAYIAKSFPALHKNTTSNDYLKYKTQDKNGYTDEHYSVKGRCSRRFSLGTE